MKVEYEYSVIRYVPRVEREEFINVGVLLYCKRKRYAALRWLVDEDRCKCLFANADLILLKAHLSSLEKICAGKADAGQLAKLEQAERVRWITANRSTWIQCAPVHTGLCTDPEYTLQELFNRLIL
ncbi:DUF3037 domain-containing protein [Sphingobacterium corticibacter]|uniref:DUF3037 domain-containing protein n=1 Tax=Sphingobacterium corticibacter TaxID=2171749 RepID=A0A2T8HLZ0_9SPHI|nr:DUF3037 domain-containing protein [Sphingobacterium corticibacter]PVH26410.1 DUF3037 domain-containing protein [Sphingobacterium corticibacter]